MTRISDMSPLNALPASGARFPLVKDGDPANYNYDLAADLAARPKTTDLAVYAKSADIAASSGAGLVGTNHSGGLDVQLDALLGKNSGTLPTGSTNTLDVERTAAGASDGTTQWYGEVRRIYGIGTNSFDYVRANYTGTHYRATAGTCANFEGEHRYIWHEGLGGSVTNAVVYGGHVRVDGGAITNEVDIFRCVSTTLGSSATIQRIVGYSVGDIGDAVKVQDVIGMDIPNLLGANSVIGVKANIAAAANKWFIYSSGAAQSVISGFVKFGAVTAPTQAIDVHGAIIADGEITSTGGRLGYSGGAGQVVTQITNKSTNVAMNKVTGQVVLVNTSIAAGAVAYFTVTDSLIASTDNAMINLKSGNATPGTYNVWIEGIANGSFVICVRNISAGALGEALTVNVSLFKGSNT